MVDTGTGKEVGSVDIVGDTDDLFYDAARKRLYVSGGERYVDVVQDVGANRSRIAHILTAAGARTSLFVAYQSRLYLARRIAVIRRRKFACSEHADPLSSMGDVIIASARSAWLFDVALMHQADRRHWRQYPDRWSADTPSLARPMPFEVVTQ